MLKQCGIFYYCSIITYSLPAFVHPFPHIILTWPLRSKRILNNSSELQPRGIVTFLTQTNGEHTRLLLLVSPSFVISFVTAPVNATVCNVSRIQHNTAYEEHPLAVVGHGCSAASLPLTFTAMRLSILT